jgi:formylglycine-generating enzyme required for sulfatase activity
MSCRSAFRYHYSPDGRFACVGFRLAFSSSLEEANK